MDFGFFGTLDFWILGNACMLDFGYVRFYRSLRGGCAPPLIYYFFFLPPIHTEEYTSCQPASQPGSQQTARQLGAGRSSKFPSTSKQIQHHWHTIRSHNHSCNKMAKQWCLDSGRIFNLRTWPALRAGQAQTLKYLPLCKHHCLAILLQLWLWLLIECQQF